ncbi:MAG: hypothetical protein ACYC63_10750 [Armatimonadota bacterium]
MRRRLFDGLDQGLGEEIQVIEGFPAPTRQRGFCSLAVTLQLALEASRGAIFQDRLPQEAVTYPELMARTGAAFMLHFANDFSPDLPLQGREAHVVQALQELGFQAELLEQPTPDAALATVRREIAAGRPACALGWGSNPTEWSLLAGFQASDLLGHSFGGTGKLERKPPTLLRLLSIGERTSASAGLAPFRVVSRAVTILHANAPHYQQWLNLLDQPEPYGPPIGQLERFLGEQRLSEALADARDAAARFLSASLSEFSVEAEDELAQAADVAERLAEMAETLLVPPEVIQRAHLPEDLDWRHDRRALLRVMMELEQNLARLLRRALWLAGAETEAGE